jgi:hypothetical protein
MARVAKVVTISLMTRVIVDENATDEQIVDAAKSKFIEKINNNELMENLEDIVEDTECPFGTFYKDGHLPERFYQPQINDEGTIVGHEDEEIFSFEVWASKEELLKQFPNCIVIEYTLEDIEEPQFVDLTEVKE